MTTTDANQLLRMLEPAVRPVAPPQPVTPAPADGPFESRSFESLLSEAQHAPPPEVSPRAVGVNPQLPPEVFPRAVGVNPQATPEVSPAQAEAFVDPGTKAQGLLPGAGVQGQLPGELPGQLRGPDAQGQLPGADAQGQLPGAVGPRGGNLPGGLPGVGQIENVTLRQLLADPSRGAGTKGALSWD